MATISITIPDAQAARVISAVCKGAGLDPSPANAKQAIIAHIRATVANVERSPRWLP